MELKSLIKKEQILFSTALSIVSFIFGAIVPDVIQDVINDTIMYKSGDNVNSYLHTNIIIVINMFFIGCSLLFFYSNNRKLEEVKNAKRLSIKYVSIDDAYGKDLYAEARDFVNHIQEGAEVIAINSFVEVFEESKDTGKEEYRKKYLEDIEKKFGRINYHRIIQLSSTDYVELRKNSLGLDAKILGNYKDHYIKILTSRDDKHTNDKQMQLSVTIAKYPISFVVITNPDGINYLIWQINEHVPNSTDGAIRLTGVFLIIDPDEQIVKYFKRWFNHLYSSGKTHPLNLEDLRAA
ncbi:hypothetical protein IC229_29785 [Spirosoma sp. BT702]|uniref:Uncharacterized protein n=1 Tax=Spirosoma profusum TaxID=2771354 RepID=A0A927GA74_9BACT|nr:hypothetical protein [Spirosoma profusum]MBD2704860.1 hypothetical protein [Spirosoma profusum]